MKKYKRHLITAALPYANGGIHIGHLAGVYIPADIYARYLRGRGEEVVWVCGSDEHGVPITIKARAEGTTPQAIVDRYHEVIRRSFEEFGTSFDIYSRTTSAVHAETASQFFRTLYDKGEFIESTSRQYFDPEAGIFLADRYIVGTCPKCGAPGAYGDQCEKCGSSLAATELIDPKSAVSGATPELRDTKHWYLPLDKHEAFLREWILEGHKEWKSNVYGQCKSWLDGGLQPRAVSRDLDWGIPVPVEGAEGKVLYVWFDAPIGYISATRELDPEGWEKWWKDPETRMVHFIGKDNIVFHCIMFPAMLRAHGRNADGGSDYAENAPGEFILPDNVPANEFLNLEGDKISTSRGWAVWLDEYLRDFPGKQDVLRYVLCANAPETKDNDFTWKDFQARANNELVAVLGNFVNRALVLTGKYYGGRVPAPGELTDYDRETLAELPKLRTAIEGHIEAFRFRDALREAMNVARLGNKYLADSEPWKVVKSDPARVETIMNIALQITANLAIAIEPFMPFTAAKTARMLGTGSLGWDSLGRADLLPAGHVVTDTPELLFEKIEDAAVEAQIAKLEATKAARATGAEGGPTSPSAEIESQNPSGAATTSEAPEPVAEIEPQKPIISFDEFSKMDIRIGTILEAAPVPKTKKLLKFKIDTGTDVREIVSGIAEHFTPGELVGRQVTIIANLAPREIKGVTSHGMILMTERADGKYSLVTPTEKVPNGKTVN
jgi:methionyl-tRNA synthetase